MDLFLSKVTQHAMNYAIRSGVTITASYALKQSSRLLKNVPKSTDRDELLVLQQRLQNKIKIISPAIDMIELISARGNTSLESAVSLTKDLRWEIQSLGQRLANAAASEESARQGKANTQVKAKNDLEIKMIIASIKTLLNRIEDAVPLINLAITTSGANLSNSLPSTVSPSRLLQASTFLTAGDTQFAMSPQLAVQVGPTFTLSVYMLFAGHVRPHDEKGMRETTWKEVMHKARVKLRRVPMNILLGTELELVPSIESNVDHLESSLPSESRADEFAYQMMIIEDLDDDRVHSFDDDEPQPGAFDDVEMAGIRDIFPIHQISKIFYADTGKVLNIGSDGETNNPVLLLKRDLNAVPPRRMMKIEHDVEDDCVVDETASSDESPANINDQVAEPFDPWRLPPGLDPEWIAFEVFSSEDDSSDESDLIKDSDAPVSLSRSESVDPELSTSISKLHIDSESPSISPMNMPENQILHQNSSSLTTTQPAPWAHSIRTSLSLLELLLRLTSLQQFQQQSHLSITDELLNFFLEESATTGAGGDEVHRQRLRADARRRVGWDPYDESPMKRRGEEYQYRNGSPRSATGEPFEEERSWRSPSMQTRSMTAFSDVQSQSPSPSAPTTKDRRTWLRDGPKSSPLRPTARKSDEGLGTSPASDAER